MVCCLEAQVKGVIDRVTEAMGLSPQEGRPEEASDWQYECEGEPRAHAVAVALISDDHSGDDFETRSTYVSLFLFPLQRD